MSWILLLFIVIVAVYLLSSISFIKETILQYYDRYLANFYAKVNSVQKNNEILTRTTKLFESMEDVINKIGGPILELGCGPGVNLQFYPSNTKLCTIDLNDHFRPHLLENMKLCMAKLERYEVGDVEDMSNIYADNTFSCVVCTKLLCCVDQEKTLREITRVLKPGGRFYFLEHVLEKRYTFTWLFQILWTPIWKRFVFNCQVDQATDIALKEFGFDNFEMAIWYRPVSWKFFFTRKTCIGFGDKAK